MSDDRENPVPQQALPPQPGQQPRQQQRPVNPGVPKDPAPLLCDAHGAVAEHVCVGEECKAGCLECDICLTEHGFDPPQHRQISLEYILDEFLLEMENVVLSYPRQTATVYISKLYKQAKKNIEMYLSGVATAPQFIITVASHIRKFQQLKEILVADGETDFFNQNLDDHQNFQGAGQNYNNRNGGPGGQRPAVDAQGFPIYDENQFADHNNKGQRNDENQNKEPSEHGFSMPDIGDGEAAQDEAPNKNDHDNSQQGSFDGEGKISAANYFGGKDDVTRGKFGNNV